MCGTATPSLRAARRSTCTRLFSSKTASSSKTRTSSPCAQTASSFSCPRSASRGASLCRTRAAPRCTLTPRTRRSRSSALRAPRRGFRPLAKSVCAFASRSIASSGGSSRLPCSSRAFRGSASSPTPRIRTMMRVSGTQGRDTRCRPCWTQGPQAHAPRARSASVLTTRVPTVTPTPRRKRKRASERSPLADAATVR
eukprot:Amastigsp_a678945_16.p3 type:complete len:197 gc:universal Amastigsp_a678945_16:595-5(-)